MPAYVYLRIASDVNYVIEKGDRLTYEVWIPKESTLAAGAVDLNLTAAPKARNNGATLRDSFAAVDQYGLFAHPASNFNVLSARTVQICGPTGKPEGMPLFARGQWLPREIDLSALRVDANGNPVAIKDVMLAIDTHDSTHLQDTCPTDPSNPKAIALFRRINIVNTDAQGKQVVKRAFYNGEEKLPNGAVSVNQGSFSNAVAAVTLVDGHALDGVAPFPPVAPGDSTGHN
jgi:hypothetical protein